MGKYGEPWTHGDGCCGPYIDWQAHEPEWDVNNPGTEPIWLGGAVSPEHRARIVTCVNACESIANPAAIQELIAAADEAAPEKGWTIDTLLLGKRLQRLRSALSALGRKT